MVDQTDRQRYFQFAATGLIAHASLKACLEHMQFCFAHGAFQAEQQAVVEMRRIVNTVFVKNQSLRQCREFKQAVPVGVVAGQA